MNMQTRQVGRMEQGLALLPKMLQSIEVLQLTSAELLSLIDRELEQNETLVAELGEPPAAAASEPDASGQGEGEATEWDASDWERVTAGPRASAGEDQKQAFLQNVADSRVSLQDHVRGQLGWLELQPEVVAGVELLAASLDHRGWLPAPVDLLQEQLGDRFPVCLAVLQSLEPRGLGAANAVEAMLLQVSDHDPDLGDITAMLTVYLDALARNKLPMVARVLGRSVEEVRGLIERIKELDPHPGARFVGEGPNEVLYPDVVVRLEQGQIEIEVDDMALPDLGLEPGYVDMVDDAAIDRQVKTYLREKLRSARDLITALEQRKRTLARTVLAIMTRQREFLEQGPLAVRPLDMEQIAADVDLHASTVSRAIAGKSVQTPFGIFLLRDFFDGDRRRRDAAADGMGRMAVRDHLRDLIQAEDPRHPLSDEELVRQLAARNISVARRTVAKYRGELGFASSWQRRRFEVSE